METQPLRSDAQPPSSEAAPDAEHGSGWRSGPDRRFPQGVPIRFSLLTLAALLLACGCEPKLPRADDPSDPEVASAIEHAQATLDDFLAALEIRTPGQSHFSLRVWLVPQDTEDTEGAGNDDDGDDDERRGPGARRPERELAWLDDVTWDGANFRGTLNRDPAFVKGHARGDEVRVARGAVADWLYIEGDRAVGGWTIRLLRRRMTDAQRAKFDEATPYTFE